MYDQYVGFIIGSTLHVLNKKIIKSLAENNIPVTTSQIVFLCMLKYKKSSDMIQQDMANDMGKDKSAVLRTIDILEKKGMVRRIHVPGDRRKNRVEITREGEAVLEAFLRIEKELTDTLKKNISEEDYATMTKVLFQIQKNASE